MLNYSLPEPLNESIVDGIFEGYRDYLDVRRKMFRELKVSGAYAWVKGNHIDHYVALACEQHGVESKLAKAGLTWQYLKFTHENEKILFIVKNARYFDPKQVDKGKDARGRTRQQTNSYMYNLMQINNRIDFDNIPDKRYEKYLQLELLEDFQINLFKNEDNKGINTQFDRFYIVTYQIDQNHYIEEVRVWMPNPIDNNAYLISDLQDYIGSKRIHRIEIEDDLKSILTQSHIPEGTIDHTSFGIVLDAKEKKK